MKIVLISTYELGRQPFGLASPAAWLRSRGHHVSVLDLSRQELDESVLREAKLIGLFVPMHTAARLAVQLTPALRTINPSAEYCVYGLYASLCHESFRKAGVRNFCGGEFEQGLCDLADALAAGRLSSAAGSGSADLQQADVGLLSSERRLNPQDGAPSKVSLSRQRFVLPDRSALPALRRYAHVILPQGGHRVAGYTEASRGCKHFCRHCPIVPVYNGIFRVVDRETVLADVRQQVAAGAQHITFGDPDFFNGVGHALPIVRELHSEFPDLSYDVTIKIEHLRKHQRELATLRDTNCLFVTSAVESLDDEVLGKLEKGHTRKDFLDVVEVFRDIGLVLQPTFVPFTPWTTLEGYRDLLETLAELDLVENVPSIQLAIRLLIPPGSGLLELADIAGIAGPFDEKLLVYPWKHPDLRVDALAADAEAIAAEAEKQKWGRSRAFDEIYKRAAAPGSSAVLRKPRSIAVPGRGRWPASLQRTAVPYLNEPWYC